ncbi:MAG: TetR/AcrR family transcriptional regulator [Pseudomonadota bacterium]
MKKRRFNKDDWIALGLDELSGKGCDAVKLEAICKAAGLTRGSFYHHFDDHETYLINLAQSWLKAQTRDVAAAIDPSIDANDQNAALTEAAIAIDYKLELGIRELGRRLPAVREIIEQADAMRLEVVSNLYEQRYGLDAELAEQFAYLEYAAFSGIILLDPDMPAGRQKALADLFESTMVWALTPEADQ